MALADFPRRILLAVTGLTPQVVTETLYALAVQAAPPFVPTEVHVITTSEGAERVRLSLLDVKDGQFHAFCSEYGLTGKIAFTAANIHVISDAGGRPLSDIRTPEDNLRSADFIAHHLREFCSDDNAALHVSIAGGRKSMGFFVGYSLSLFGRAQDRLSHVLVSEPFESHREFFYPPREARVLYDRNDRPASTADARIMLAEIPFVRLRGGVPASLLQRDVTFSEAVTGTQSGLSFISVSFDVLNRAIICGNQPVKLPPNLFAFYWWLASVRARHSEADEMLRWRDADPGEFLDFYQRVEGALSARYGEAARSLKDGFTPDFFEIKKSKINKLLRHSMPLGNVPYLVQSVGRKPETGYGLILPKDCISLPSI